MNVMVFKPYLQKAGTHSSAAFSREKFWFGLNRCFFDTLLQDPNQHFASHQEIVGIIPVIKNIND